MTRQFTSIMLTISLVLSLGMQGIQAQEVTSVESFELTDSEGKQFVLKDHKEQKAVLVFFTSSNCVFATRYNERIKQLHETFKDKAVSFVAINSNDANLSQRDHEAVMRQYAPFSFPYLKDKTQEVAKLFGAKVNPEVFVLVPKDGKFDIAYHGAIDDNIISKGVKKQFAHDAVQSILDGKAPTTKTSEGKSCEIRWVE